MKKILFIALVIASGLLYQGALQAQVRLNVNFNVGSQPVWGPVGYDYAQYYYFPDIDAYYDVASQQYVYLNGGSWMFAPTLPPRYNFDVYRGYKVVINQPNPWMQDNVYRNKYARYKGQEWYGSQPIIRDSRDSKYFIVKGHPMYGKGNEQMHARGHEDHGERGHGHDHGHN
ncbi:hypothetical protein [Chitinophaga flava]|uniref:Uncharacterized protein n=1 Tax=Chitinophaga flava TaxID=2259036 RepID=A0A365Y0C4_9BACT|nr:hypothetical protein [Chitinophaga flava]RBL92062.1 hypothetical protein DF182_05565 [Chitinophaga flava]